jgi:hypothetical protein
MAIARKHHYVPQMYLTGFTNDKDQCFVVDASTRKPFISSTANIAAERDYNKIEAQGVPADALEKELGKFEGVIAPGIKRVRETGSFGESGKDREDIINLIALLAVRDPRTRNDMDKLYTELFQAMVATPFEDLARWDAVVEQLKAAEQWPEGAPVDFEGHKKFQGLCRAARAQGGRFRRPFLASRLPHQCGAPRCLGLQDEGRVAAQVDGRAASVCARRRSV